MGCACASERDQDPKNQRTVCSDYREYQNYYSGHGIKRTRAWQGTISKIGLKRQRERFWNQKKPGNETMWMHLRQAIEADEASSLAIIQQAGLQLIDVNIQVTRDFEGHTYNIPIFVINDPANWRQNQVQQVETVEMEILIRISGAKDIKITVKNNKKIKEIKYEAEMQTARFFFGGKEMYNSNKLMDYPIQAGMVVQALIQH